ncbi:PSD1 and planctomycete cytochrome C domain-containing protein [Fibrella aquatilis]|uniref:PSD1 domain-containing protein n=1 Tax=Fibrella aquatilis TaxID=2817059 RepID=A0A939G8X3_9BACT|nr:PSD1 and planctomycete cytochrome C domain-containing protein [Fibrella aquatilis]MBO0932789.1 PSD1 domain-containing protein [Fibrella aquatilis]
MTLLAASFWLWQLLGRLHPLIVHFPVGLLCVAGLLELVGAFRRSGEWRAGVRAMVWIGAGSAVVAAALGLLLVNQESYTGATVATHQWLGVATMALALLTVIALQAKRIVLYRSLLAITVIGLSLAGHYGAMVTHGDDYLSSVLPSGQPATAPADPKFAFASTGQPLDAKQVAQLNLDVRSILAHNCYSCHGANKVKGGLRLDSRAAVMTGGDDGPVLVAHFPEKSDLIRRVKLPAGHDDAMPTKGKRLTDSEIALLEFWIKQGAPWPNGPEKSLYRVAALEPRTPALPPATADLTNPVDRFVNVYFRQHHIAWKAPVDDQTYLRRVYLDVVGLLPSPEQVSAFTADTRPDKRERLVHELLTRDADYAQHWMTFWNDALRNDYTGTGYITGGRFDITNWLYTSLKANKPYNQFVRELVSPTKASAGFIKGIHWRGTINASQKTEMQAAQNVSQVLLGLNLKCASCHDSFISDWKLADAYAFANVFSDTILEINRCDKPTGKMADRKIIFQQLGTINGKAPTAERLRQLAEFMVQPKNGRLYRTVVNRVWAQVMGRGLVEPVDVMDNEPWSQDLLDWLATDFVSNRYNIKALLAQILTSRTYQLPTVGVKDPDALMAPGFVFTGMVRRRLTAEQFADAVSAVFTPIYPDSAVVTTLLPRQIGREMPFARAVFVKNDPFLTALGRPNRETVSTSRTSQANLLQALELTNGEQFNKALSRAAQQWKTRYPAADVLVKQLYKKALAREPTLKEQAVAERIIGAQPGTEGVQDLIWAISLHPEFQLIY